MEAEDGRVISMGSTSCDSVALVGGGCIMELISGLCVADPSKGLADTACTRLLIPRGVKQCMLIVNTMGAKPLVERWGGSPVWR
jgi:hypothetical protein